MKQKGSKKVSIFIKWFPPSWFQIKYKDQIIYIDPAWMRTLFTNYQKKVEKNSEIKTIILKIGEVYKV